MVFNKGLQQTIISVGPIMMSEIGTSAVICNIGDDRATALQYLMRLRLICSLCFTMSQL